MAVSVNDLTNVEDDASDDKERRWIQGSEFSDCLLFLWFWSGCCGLQGLAPSLTVHAEQVVLLEQVELQPGLRQPQQLDSVAQSQQAYYKVAREKGYLVNGYIEKTN